MIIAIATDKGGNGKTPLAINIATDNDYLIATNQKFNIYENVLDDDKLLVIGMNDTFPSALKNNDYDVIIDLAGQVSEGSKSVLSAVEIADAVLVPIMNDRASINGGVNTIEQLKSYNSNIVAIATGLKLGRKEINNGDWTRCEEFLNIQSEVHHYHPGIKVMPLKYTTGFTAVINEIKSLKQLSETNPLLKAAYSQVIKHFEDIYSHVIYNRK